MVNKNQCPHCLKYISVQYHRFNDGSYALDQSDKESNRVFIEMIHCPACKKIILIMNTNHKDKIIKSEYIIPKNKNSNLDTTHIPNNLVKDYLEACSIIPLSSNASATLSRRCLQSLLKEKGYKKYRLKDSIQELLDEKTLPLEIANNIDYLRKLGNFGSHETNDVKTTEIIDVEPVEAEWLLTILESLFDFYYITPEKNKQERNKLNEKINKSKNIKK